MSNDNKTTPVPERESKIFYIDEVRYLVNQYTKKEISIGKLTEILNEECKRKGNIENITPNE